MVASRGRSHLRWWAALALLVAALPSCGMGSGTSRPDSTPVATPVVFAGNAVIEAAVVSSAIAADGGAADARSLFHHAKDRTVRVVLTLAKVTPGAKLSYIRKLDGKFVDSKSVILDRAVRHFYFTFTALEGKTLAAGSYDVRLYVNERYIRQASYHVD